MNTTMAVSGGTSPGQVAAQLGQLECAISELRTAFEAVEERLVTVLLPGIQPPPARNGPATLANGPAGIVPLALDIQRLTEHVNKLAGAVRNMLERIQA